MGEFETVMQTRDKVSGVHNCWEFFQPLECKNKVTFPRKNTKLFVMVLIKTEIFTSCKVLYTKSCTRIKSVLVLQKMLSKIRIFLA